MKKYLRMAMQNQDMKNFMPEWLHRYLIVIVVGIFLCLLIVYWIASPVKTDYENLVKRNGLYYEKSTDTPFSGHVKGKKKGRIKDGEKDGIWRSYYKNGRLGHQIVWRNGKTYGVDGKRLGCEKEWTEDGRLKWSKGKGCR